MQLQEILDENSISAISKKTNISEDNINALINAEFDKIKRVKTMGFISILERDYGADLSKLKEEALEYYGKHYSKEGVTLGMPILTEEKKGKSKLFMLIVFFLIMYALWYAFVNFDEKKLSAILPFSEQTLSGLISSVKEESATEQSDVENLSIEHVNAVSEQEKEENTSVDTNRS